MIRKLKILYVITDLGMGGAERLLIDICTELEKHKNVEFKIATVFNSNNHIEATKGFDIVNLGYKPAKFLKKQRLASYENLVNEFKPDIVHTHRYLAEYVSSLYVVKGIRYFCHGHDNMVQLKDFKVSFLLDKKKFVEYFEKLKIYKSKYSKVKTVFISISEDTDSYYKNLRVLKTNQKFILFKNAINYNKFLRKKNKFDNKLKLINIGSFQHKKNQIFLIDIAKVLKDRGVKFEFLLLGDGLYRPKVLDKIRKENLTNEVFCNGNVCNVEKYLWESNIYIHSAYYEPFGLVLLEAMAAGLPVVTLDGKGNRDLIEEGLNGYMIYEQDAEKFADTIIKLWTDKQKMKKISEYANDFAKQYDIKNYVNNLLEVYQNIINSK